LILRLEVKKLVSTAIGTNVAIVIRPVKSRDEGIVSRKRVVKLAVFGFVNIDIVVVRADCDS